MSREEPFEFEVAGDAVRGCVVLPDEGDRFPAFLCCVNLACEREKPPAFMQRLGAAVVAAGWAYVHFRNRGHDASEARGRSYTAADSVDDAAAVFRHVLLRDDIDERRVVVAGFSLGTLPAAGLARRTDQIAALVLVSPVLPASAIGILDSDPGLRVLDRVRETIEQMTPVEDAVFHDRPTVVLQGAADALVDPAVSRQFAAAIEIVGHQVDHLLVAQADHFFEQPDTADACIDRLLMSLEDVKAEDTAEAPA